jgi:transposase-like protein
VDENFSRTWAALSQEVITGMHEWRLAHPTASLNEIEAALDERLGRLRAQMLQDAAVASAAREGSAQEGAVVCPQCGSAAAATRQQPTRQLQSAGGAPLELTRRRWQCRRCGVGFFPPG